MTPDADLIIAGAGCAGLSALWHAMQHADAGTRILVVDRSLEPGSERTWAFWGPPDAPFAHLADRSWSRIQVRFPGWDSTQELGFRDARVRPRVYMRVRQQDYDSAVLAVARSRPNVRFVETDIHDVADEPGTGLVSTSAGELRAPLVFQSVQLAPRDRVAPVRHPLRQHFGGWEVRTERPVFDPEIVTLMDFDTEQHDGTAFFYVLPEEPDRALVEHTLFSPHPRETGFYDDHLRDRLAQLGAGAVSIERQEYGSIPMEDRVLHQRWGAHVWNLGTVGGMTKPTTGYTFQRIHAQAHHLVTTWMRNGAPEPLPTPPGRFAFADRTLLNILHRHPERGRPIFERLFQTSSIDEVLTFLDEHSSMTQDARLISKLPWRPFLQAAAAELGADLVARGRHRRAA
jgi:lycopene beta-cyclase